MSSGVPQKGKIGRGLTSKRIASILTKECLGSSHPHLPDPSVVHFFPEPRGRFPSGAFPFPFPFSLGSFVSFDGPAPLPGDEESVDSRALLSGGGGEGKSSRSGSGACPEGPAVTVNPAMVAGSVVGRSRGILLEL